MPRYDILGEQAERFWDKFVSIGQALGIRFARTALGDGRNRIVLQRIVKTITPSRMRE